MKRAALLILMLAACKPEAEATLPAPVEMTAAAVGHFCQMNVLEHPGPKAQVFLKDVFQPLFFSQVRDAIAYQRLPEQDHEIVAIYVSDMSRAPSWENPGPLNWMPAADAVYVIGSARTGGMGAPETVPFSARADAEAFVARHGGDIRALADIPNELVLSPAGPTPEATGDDPDYAARLRALSKETTP